MEKPNTLRIEIVYTLAPHCFRGALYYKVCRFQLKSDTVLKISHSVHAKPSVIVLLTGGFGLDLKTASSPLLASFGRHITVLYANKRGKLALPCLFRNTYN